MSKKCLLTRRIASLSLACLLLTNGLAQASVIRTDTSVFRSDRSEIDFSSLPVGTINPVFESANGATDGDVAFAGLFDGQRPGDASSCGFTGCVIGDPIRSLSLNRSAVPVFTAELDSAPDNQVLSGMPALLGPISILFGVDQSGVGLSIGSAAALGAARVTAFDRNGDILASTLTDALGYSSITLADTQAEARIAGLQITRTGADAQQGLVLDRMLFGGPDQVRPGDRTSVDAPGNPALFCLAVVGIALVARRRRLDIK